MFDNCLVAAGLLDDGRSMLPRLNDLLLCVVKGAEGGAGTATTTTKTEKATEKKAGAMGMASTPSLPEEAEIVKESVRAQERELETTAPDDDVVIEMPAPPPSPAETNDEDVEFKYDEGEAERHMERMMEHFESMDDKGKRAVLEGDSEAIERAMRDVATGEGMTEDEANAFGALDEDGQRRVLEEAKRLGDKVKGNGDAGGNDKVN